MTGMEPFLIAAAAGASAVGGVVSFMQSQSAADDQRKAGDAAAQAANINAETQENRGRDEINAAAAEASNRRRSLLKQMGTARANYGGSGVQIEGTPSNVLSDLASEVELDTALTKYGGQVKGKYANDEAAITRFEGAQRRSAAYSEASGTESAGFGSLLGGLAGAASTGAKIKF